MLEMCSSDTPLIKLTTALPLSCSTTFAAFKLEVFSCLCLTIQDTQQKGSITRRWTHDSVSPPQKGHTERHAIFYILEGYLSYEAFWFKLVIEYITDWSALTRLSYQEKKTVVYKRICLQNHETSISTSHVTAWVSIHVRHSYFHVHWPP